MRHPFKVWGLCHCMKQASKEYRRASKKLTNARVHDLRVAIRKCRTIAGAYQEIGEKIFLGALEKPARRLFKKLGPLRDIHVLIANYHKILPNAHYSKFEKVLRQERQNCEKTAAKAIRKFPIKKWKRLTKKVSKLYVSVEANQKIIHFIRAAIKKILTLHQRVLKTKSEKNYHQLRMVFKQLRYLIENLAPESMESKIPFQKFQDLLGTSHDLSNLQNFIVRHRNLFPSSAIAISKKRISAIQTEKIQVYQRLMLKAKARMNCAVASEKP